MASQARYYQKQRMLPHDVLSCSSYVLLTYVYVCVFDTLKMLVDEAPDCIYVYSSSDPS